MTYYPLLLSILAGLSTLIGIVFIYIKFNYDNLIKYSLALAAGVMICISILDLLPEAIFFLSKDLTKIESYIYLVLSVFIGSLVFYVLNIIINKKENDLYRVGVLSMIATMIHNILEGIITYISVQANIKLGLAMIFAITLHNIPEGVSVVIPVFYGTRDKKKAIIMIMLSAFSEPLGVLLAAIFLKKIMTDVVIGLILGVVAGIMSFISLVELLPTALSYNNKIKTMLCFINGIIFMYIIIWLIK